MSCFNKKRYTIKPGTPEYGTTEHGTAAEQRNTPEQRKHTKRRTILVFLKKYKSHFNIFKSFNSRLKYLLLLI